MRYREELCRAMNYLGTKPDTIFLGQAVRVPGTAMSGTVEAVPDNQKIELPVAEELQMGMSIGLGLAGYVPISIYPRWNFLILAMNQLVSHLDKIVDMSQGGYRPKVIVRTAIGSTRPIHPQSQHVGDYTDAVSSMLTTVDVIRLEEPEDIFPAYEKAYNRTDGRSTLLVEYGDYYNEK